MQNERRERGYLPLKILSHPIELPKEVTREYDKKSIFRHIDDQKIVLDLSVFSWIEFGIWTACFLFCFMVKTENESFVVCILFYTTQLVFFLAMLSCILKYKKQIILNRREGTITYPKFLLPIQETILFDNAKFLTGFVGLQGESFPCLRLRRKDGRTWVTFNTANVLYYTYIWYMDRNRPLPPGTVFNPYREKDYQLRKTEGFPAPLYDSYVNTPDIGDIPGRYNKYTIDNPDIVSMYTQIIGN